MSAIEVVDLHKSYGDQVAVDGLSFRVEPGEVYALLGHNGAGKSTTVEILEGHREASSGEVNVLGANPAESTRDFRDRIGIVLQQSAAERGLTVRETIEFYGAPYRNPRPVAELVELAGLTDKVNARVGTLSGGQRRRLDLAIGIVGHPELLFLDEPTTGFDPVARRQSWDLVRRLGEGGTTVLLTTHYLDEAEQLADRVGVLRHGRLVAEGTPAQLIAAVPAAVISFDLPEGVSPGELSVDPSATIADGTVRFETEQPTAAIAAISGAAVDRGIELPNLALNRPTLEDVFLAIGGEADQ